MFFHIVPVFIVVLYFFRNDIQEKYNNIKEINSLVRTQYTFPPKVYWVTFSMILQMYYQQLLQKFSNVTIKDRKTLIVSYTFQEREYKIMVDLKSGPPKIEKIYNKNQKDISQKILPFLGPSENWHNREFTPKMLEEESIEFYFQNGTIKKFEQNEKIILK